MDLPLSSYDPDRRHYFATPILKSLARFKTSLTQVERVLGVVAVDQNFVFGETDPREGVAVISHARLRPESDDFPPDETLLNLRLLKEGGPRLVHTCGLSETFRRAGREINRHHKATSL